jgi:hypothetical protein
MSWDISIGKFSRTYAAVHEISDDEKCYALGTRAQVQAAISTYFKTTSWCDPLWGQYEGHMSNAQPL